MITPISKNDFVYVYFNYHKNAIAHYNNFYIFLYFFYEKSVTFPKEFLASL